MTMTDINKTLNEIIKLIENDALAASCQSMSQYRAILIKEAKKRVNN